MGLGVAQKILKAHLAGGSLEPGREMMLRIDQTLTQDATGTMVYLQFEAMGIDRARCELAVSYVDHNTIQVGFENADDHRYLQSVAARYGIVFSRTGNGICHQVHLERFGIPGKTLLGSDSHTPTAGGIGMIGIGAGGIDVACALGGGAFCLTAPRVVRIELTGRLRPWVSAKDVILRVLQLFSTRGNVGRVFEYGGPGAATLDVPSRATITNMGAECGVTTSVFPSDEVTRAFMEGQGRGADWSEIKADADAAYEKVVEIDLSALEPLAAAPHSPDNIVTVASLRGKRVQQALVGSCTNSSYRDLRTVAEIVRGRTVHPDVSAGVAPGSRQVLEMIAADGSLAAFIGAGFRVLECACGFCIGNSMSPQSEAVSVRTSNRNFEGRSGTQSAQVYLVSPETAALCALAGAFALPEDVPGVRWPAVGSPEKYVIDDAMIVRPPRDGSAVEIVRGPNIGQVPRAAPPPAALDGVVAIKVGDKVTTDHIMPAGARLKYRSNIPKYAEFVFENVDKTFAARAKAMRDAGRANVIVAGDSYGQGSSREHAAMCPMYLGVRAVVAKSFERIHMANLINFGIVPMAFADAADYARVSQGDAVRVARLDDAIAGRCDPVLEDLTAGVRVPLKLALTERQRSVLAAGGMLNSVKGGGAVNSER